MGRRMENGLLTDEMRDVFSHIAEAHHRFEELENDLGYWSPVVYAAYLTAKKIHAGQLDKGGNDYFTSHLLKVGSAGFDWK